MGCSPIRSDKILTYLFKLKENLEQQIQESFTLDEIPLPKRTYYCPICSGVTSRNKKPTCPRCQNTNLLPLLNPRQYKELLQSFVLERANHLIALLDLLMEFLVKTRLIKHSILRSGTLLVKTPTLDVGIYISDFYHDATIIEYVFATPRKKVETHYQHIELLLELAEDMECNALYIARDVEQSIQFDTLMEVGYTLYRVVVESICRKHVYDRASVPAIGVFSRHPAPERIVFRKMLCKAERANIPFLIRASLPSGVVKKLKRMEIVK